MAAAWTALAGSAPQVRLDVTQMEPEEALPALLRGETDVAVAPEYDLLPRPLDPLFERRELRADPVLLAVPEGHPLAAASTPVPLQDLSGLPFLAPRDTTSCVTLVPTLAARGEAQGTCLLWPDQPVTRQVFAVSRRGGDRQPAVRVVLDALAAEAARLPADPAVPAPAPA